MKELVVSNVTKTFGNGEAKVTALEDLTFQLEKGELACLIGFSGCGKTTTLRIIAGFIEPTSGTITLNGREVTGPGADRGVVFQQHTLFPWLSVQGNVEFGLQVRGVAKSKRQSLVRKYLQLVGLEEFGSAATYELSGGMKQRVGLARALANDPELLLMDEPFGALDAFTREKMEVELLKIWEETGKTVLFITHDVEEAVFIGSQVIVFTPRPGSVDSIYEVTYSQQFLSSGEYDIGYSRSLKTESSFVKTREEILRKIRLT